MSVLLRRWLFATLLSLGLALLLAPFPYARTSTVEREFVDLRRSPPPLVRESPPPSLGAEELDAMPGLVAMLETMDERSDLRGPVVQDEIERLCASGVEREEGGACRGRLLLRYEGMDLAIHLDDYVMGLREIAEQRIDVPITIRHVQMVQPAEAPDQISPEELERAPALAAFLNSYEGRPELPFYSGVAAGEWRALCRERGWPEEKEFLFGSWHYRASVDTRWIDESQPIRHLRATARVTGLSSLALAALLALGLYRPVRRAGIVLASGTTAALFDGITVFFLALAWVPVLDLLMVRRFDADGLLDDPPVTAIAAVAGLVASIAMVWFTSELAESRLKISERQVELEGLLGSESLQWEDVTSLSLEDSFVAVGRGGFLVPRWFRRNLRIDGLSEVDGSLTPIRIKEPPSRKTRTRIFSELRLKAPERLQADVDEIAGAW